MIVIAVIAILAAVLIPTFSGLIKKTDETIAFSDARNYAAMLLPEIVEKVNQAGDLLIIQQKGDDYYVHAYLVDEGRTVSYKENPIANEILTFVLTQNFFDYDSTLKYMAEAAVIYLSDKNIIYQSNDADYGKSEWWTDTKINELAAQLNFDVDKTRVRADYKVIREAFEQSSLGDDHQCTAETLTLYAAQESTCTKCGHDAYYVCKCGKLFSDASADSILNEIALINPIGHKYQTYVQLSDGHYQTCSVCGGASERSQHVYEYFELDNGYDHKCACGYADSEYNENTQPATFKLAMQLNLYLKSGNHPTMYDAFDAIKSSSDYQNITEIISAIDSAEQSDSDKQYKIVWDQVIDRFVVLEPNDENQYNPYYIVFVPYYADYWANSYTDTLWGTIINCKQDDGKIKLNMYEHLRMFWDTFDFNDSPIKTEDNNNGSICSTGFSVYLEGDETIDVSECKKNIILGFDMGECTVCDANSDSFFQFEVSNHSGIPFIIRTTDNAKIAINSDGNSSENYIVYHYGRLRNLQLEIKNKGRTGFVYHEFGEINAEYSDGQEKDKLIGITAGGDYVSSTTFIAESGSKIKQSIDMVKNLGLKKVESNGGEFSYNFEQ